MYKGGQDLSLPKEITDTVNRFPGYSLCVKGAPGSGKTVFTLTFLKEICENGNGLYVSTRVDPDRLYEMFPWAKKSVPPSGVIDAVNSRPAKDGGLLKNLRYGNMPGFVQALDTIITDIDEPIISIDSWDAVAQTVGEREPCSIEMILDLAIETSSRLVLVTETSNPTSLEYLVDGVVELGFKETVNDVNRYIQIKKLRGSKHDLRKRLLEITDEGLQVKGVLYE